VNPEPEAVMAAVARFDASRRVVALPTRCETRVTLSFTAPQASSMHLSHTASPRNEEADHNQELLLEASIP
jgi:hypothetical protein